MPQPTVSDVHVNAPLTNISVAYLQRASHFIAAQVFPNIPVPKRSDRYYTYDRHFFNRDEMKKRAPGTESAGGGYELDNTPNYFCDVWAYHKDIDDDTRGNSDSVLAPDREATEYVTHKALIKREKLWAATYLAGSIWSLDMTGVASGPTGNQFLQWNDASSTPILDIRAQITRVLELTGYEPNTLVTGRHTWDALVDNPEIIDRVKYGQTAPGPAIVNQQTVATVLGLQRILVMNAIETTSAEGASSDVSAFIGGGKTALLCYVTPSPGIMTPTAGYTFAWTGKPGMVATGQRIKRFRMEHLESDRVEIDMAFDQKLVSADLGTFFATAVA
jgi:hypothetical protein